MSMRVIAGELRHRNLVYPENNKGIRPTKDRIKEAFFSSLGDISNTVFLDICAGCGGMGIEAISRGSKKAILIDNNKESLKYINANITNLKIQNAVVLPYDALVALEKLAILGEKIDLVYLDPPYESPIYEQILSYIYNSNLLSDHAIVAIEANRKIDINPLWYSKIKEYHYGEIVVTVLRK